VVVETFNQEAGLHPCFVTAQVPGFRVRGSGKNLAIHPPLHYRWAAFRVRKRCRS
jgi:hypothetical protein